MSHVTRTDYVHVPSKSSPVPLEQRRDTRARRAKPAPTMDPPPSSVSAPTSLRASLVEAARLAEQGGPRARSEARARRDDLLRYANDRGASVRGLAALTGLSVSTVHVATSRSARDRDSILDDPTPPTFIPEGWVPF